MIDCVSTVPYSFILNGRATGFFRAYKGLRQWDPLSLYLFLICAEGLFNLITRSENCGDFFGFHCSRYGPNHPPFSSLMIASCFVKPLWEAVRKLAVLKVYERGSGQMVNLQKSNITFNPNMIQGLKANIQAVFRVDNA